MIDLYTWATPNGRKVSVMLEETALSYTVHPVNLSREEQFKPAFLAISPANKIPAIIDRSGPGGEPVSVFESGAILIYLAEKTGMLLPLREPGRSLVMQWLVFQMGQIGPMFGQAFHFLNAETDLPYAKERYGGEVKRIAHVLEQRLGEAAFLADEFSIADIASYPWALALPRLGLDMSEYAHISRWLDTIGARPAVSRGMAIPS